jgi:predicted kinase
MQVVFFCKGLPGSGKSTWAKEMVRTRPGIVRINKDDLRAMLHDNRWDKPRERTVLLMRDAMLETALRNGLSAIIDDTNLADFHFHTIRRIVLRFPPATLEVKLFQVPVEECIRRDSLRNVGKVGEKVIRDMYERYGES